MKHGCEVSPESPVPTGPEPLIPMEEAARMVVDTWKSMPKSVRSRMWIDFQAQLVLLERAVDWTRKVGAR